MSFGDADEEAEDAAGGLHYESSVTPMKCICGNDWICPTWYAQDPVEDVPSGV